ncbi:MAG: hypothetical protein HYZ91_02990 [Candidatus Omnitrophica bacterium]|nr:hypothetical protein [Candidatus Omnitrophota bacterium]
MDVILHGASPLQGSLTVPPDKAICHRAVLIAALAEGETELRPWPSAEDCQRTLQLIQSLGAVVRRSSTSVWIQGCGVDGIRPPGCELWCGESGTTMRLGAGFLAGQPFTATLTGGPSLSRRPMRRVAEPLTQMGAHVEGATSASRSGAQELYPPLVVRGRRPLRAIRYTMPVSSAQVKSTVLLAALAADGPTIIQEPQQTRDHTERMLRHFGGHVEGNGREVSIEPGRLVSPGMLELPGDFSSAAFFP